MLSISIYFHFQLFRIWCLISSCRFVFFSPLSDFSRSDQMVIKIRSPNFIKLDYIWDTGSFIYKYQRALNVCRDDIAQPLSRHLSNHLWNRCHVKVPDSSGSNTIFGTIPWPLRPQCNNGISSNKVRQHNLIPCISI